MSTSQDGASTLDQLTAAADQLEGAGFIIVAADAQSKKPTGKDWPTVARRVWCLRHSRLLLVVAPKSATHRQDTADQSIVFTYSTWSSDTVTLGIHRSYVAAPSAQSVSPTLLTPTGHQ